MTLDRRCIGLAALALIVGEAAAGYRFEDPALLNLSSEERLLPLQGGPPIPVTVLPSGTAAAILAAPELGEKGPGLVTPLDGEDKIQRRKEAARLATDAPAVHRTARTLVVQPQSGMAVEFTDTVTPRRKDVDGDSETFFYAGRLGTTGYYQVEERFQQDAPAAYFVNPGNGKTAFGQPGADSVVLSPGGQWLLSVHTMPLLIAVAALGPSGPTLKLVCQGKPDNTALKGWSGESAFDLGFTLGTPGEKGSRDIPVRVEMEGDAWQLATSDADALGRMDIHCRPAATGLAN